jgi:phage terminase large subunit GpA-like protein
MSTSDPLPPPEQLWTDAERAAWAPPEELNTPEWAERNRELSRKQTSRPGPWHNDNQPALVGLMYLCSRPGVAELWAMKSGQFGASEGGRNAIGRTAQLDPSPFMLVLADEKSGRKIVRKRIIPLFEDTPVLRQLLTGNTRDKKLTSIALSNGFELSLAWAGSSSALASDPYKRVWLDEVDKYAAAAQQADPVGEARVRLRTYRDTGESLLLATSTPSTSIGPIAVGFEDCPIKLHYFAPCPHCGTAQRLTFDRLKWDKFPELTDAKRRAARVKSREAAWMECVNPNCAKDHPAGQGRILERHKRKMLIEGYWATDDQAWRIYFDCHEEGEKPEGDKVGMHIHALIDLSIKFWEVAAEFIEANGRPDKLKDFYNLTLGEPFKDPVAVVTSSIFRQKCVPDPETDFTPARQQLLQPWVSRILLTVDTQKDHFWFVLRGWGYGLRSHRIHHGRAGSFEELEDLFKREWPYENDVFPPLPAFRLGIDSGGGVESKNRDANRTEQVYTWCNLQPMLRLALKGASKPLEAPGVRTRDRTYAPIDGRRPAFPIRLYLLDGAQFRDLLASQIRGTVQIVNHESGEVQEVQQWALNDFNDEEHYNRHLSNVIKSRVKSGRYFVDRYMPKTEGARHDLHDCETYQQALAQGMGLCVALPSLESMKRSHEQARKIAAVIPNTGGFRKPDGRPFFPSNRR